MAKQIVIEVSDEAFAMAEVAAKKYGYETAAEWGKDWLKTSLVSYQQQQHTTAAQKEFEKSKRGVEALFEE